MTGTGSGEGLTYHQDVRPVLHQYCGTCHDGSGIGPGNFMEYESAAIFAQLMLDRIDAGEMPPPAADPDCTEYVGDEWMVMDPAARDVIADWIAGGTLEGDAATATPLQEWGPQPLARVDVEMVPPAAYTPQFTDSNEYRCFVLDTFEEETYITGLEALIDNAGISHHAVLFLDPNGGSESLVTDEATQSFTCPQVVPRREYQMIHAWAPSGGPLEFPEGMGLPVSSGTQLILQMHYWDGMATTPADRPGYAMKLSSSVDQEILYVPLGPEGFVIPAGNAAFTVTERYSLPELTYNGLLEWDILGVMPHMHVLGTSYDFKAGNKCISRAAAYDFDLQPTYWFENPVTLDVNDDAIEVSCTYDNSAGNPEQLADPPVDVTWGENTQQEMCYALMYALPRIAGQ